MEGWIKFYRKFLEWEWYGDINVCRLFLHLLLSANFDERKWQGITIGRGEVVVGRKQLAKETGLTEQQIRTALVKLENTAEITIKTTNKYSVITICNYAKYQDIEMVEQPAEQPTNNQQITNNQPTNNQQITTNEELKNIRIKELKNNSVGRFSPPSVEEVKFYCMERENNVDAQRFVNFYEMKGWMVGKNKMKDWKAAVRTWEGKSTSTTSTAKGKENLDVNRFWNVKK